MNRQNRSGLGIGMAVLGFVAFSQVCAAGVVAVDGNVPSDLFPGGTEADPAIYIIGSTTAYVRDFGSTPLYIGYDTANVVGCNYVHLYIRNGSTVTSGDWSSIGSFYSNGHDLVRLTDASTWTVAGQLNCPAVGNDNRLEVFGGSLVNCSTLSIGGGPTSDGKVVVSNANSRIVVSGDIIGGFIGSSEMTIEDHALVQTSGSSVDIDYVNLNDGFFAWQGDHTSESNPFMPRGWDGANWQNYVNFAKTYYATDAEAKLATSDPDSEFAGYDNLGGYTIYSGSIRMSAENLLLNSGFDADFTDWTIDSGTPTLLNDWRGYIGPLFYFSGASAGQIHQDVDLLAAGFLASDINAGLHGILFGGWQNSHEGLDTGQISVIFLDASMQELGSVSLPPNAPTTWTQYQQTTAIPAQTATLRYVFTGTMGSGGNSQDVNSYLDEAYLDVIDWTPDVNLTVESAHGALVPMVGIHTNTYGSSIVCSVADETLGLSNYTCLGWTLSGNDPASGTTNAFDLTLTNNAVLTWNWQTNYWLDVTVSGSGSVSQVSGWNEAGAEQILSATPDAGWLFMGWSGAASGTNEAFITMDTPKTVMATFSDDADDDGLTNAEEAALGSNPWKSDTDDDGFDDAFEVAQGLSVTNDSSAVVDYIANKGCTFGLYPSNAVLDVAVGQILLETDGGNATLSLKLEESGDLVTWTNAGDTVEWTRAVDGEKQFFRVRSGK